VFRGVVKLAGAVVRIESAGVKHSRMAGEWNGPLILRQRDVRELTRAIHGEIDVFLVRLQVFPACVRKATRCWLVFWFVPPVYGSLSFNTPKLVPASAQM